MARRRCLFEMRPDEPIEGIRMSASALSDKEILRWVREMVEGRLKIGGLTPFTKHPSQGYLSLVSHVLLRPPRPPRSLLFFDPLFAFTVLIGDERRVSLSAARSRGRSAAGGEPGARRGAEEAEGCRGGKAHEEDP